MVVMVLLLLLDATLCLVLQCKRNTKNGKTTRAGVPPGEALAPVLASLLCIGTHWHTTEVLHAMHLALFRSDFGCPHPSRCSSCCCRLPCNT